MDEAGRAKLEADVRARLEAGDASGGVTIALRGYGREIYGFLLALHRNEQDASDAFSMFSEDLWRGLPKFAWSCTLRAWAYTLARNASHRFKTRGKKKGEVPFDSSGPIAEVAQQVRTETREWLKTEQKDRFAAIRATLPEEDQTLLILRVDRGLAWEDLAQIMLGEEQTPDDEVVKREAARLRKRFQLVKEKLVELGKKAGLIKPKE